MSELNGSFGQADGLVGTLGTDKSLNGYLGTVGSLTGELGGSLIPGPQGPQGEKGEKGDKGDRGETGATGPAGVQGEKGPKGDRGEPGEKGDVGEQGPPGVRGEKGEKGDKGDTGAVGEPGPKGEKGDTGESGPQGLKGDKGERGDTGATGPIGPAGPQGDQGPQGETGPKGDKGEQGEAGATGPMGPKGDTGDTGPVGPKGDKGDPGDDYILTQQDKEDIAGLVDDKLIVNIGSAVNETTYRIDSTFLDILDALTRGVHVVVKDANAVYPYVGVTQINNEFVIAFGTSVTYENTSVLIGYIILQANLAAKVTQQAIIPTETSQLINDSLVSDVQINGSSVVVDGVAEIPIATNDGDPGAVKINQYQGIRVSSNALAIYPSITAQVKAGTNEARPIVPKYQHESVFYGLAKAAGDTTQSASSNAVGNYTDDAKIAIKQMLDIKEPNPQIIHQVFTVEEEAKTLYFHFGKKLKKIWIGITQNSVYDVTASMYFRLISADNTRLTSFWTPRVTHTSNTKYYVKCWAEVNDFGITDMFCTGTSTDKSGYVTLQSHPSIFVIDKNLFEGIELQLNSMSSTTKWAVGTEFEIYALLQDGETAPEE